MSTSSSTSNPSSVLGLNTRLLLQTVPPVLGLLLGYFLPRIAEWASTLPWVPFQGPFEMIASFQTGWTAVVTSLLGLAGGVWFSRAAIRDTLLVTVSDEEVRLEMDGTVRSVARGDVGAVFIDGKQLVILETSGRELARERYESTSTLVAQAFERHNYPWSPDGDPHADRYRRWVPDTPDLPPAVNALMRAREKALEKQDSKDAKDLRVEVAKLGFVLRDDGTRQYWRVQAP